MNISSSILELMTTMRYLGNLEIPLQSLCYRHSLIYRHNIPTIVGKLCMYEYANPLLGAQLQQHLHQINNRLIHSPIRQPQHRLRASIIRCINPALGQPIILLRNLRNLIRKIRKVLLDSGSNLSIWKVSCSDEEPLSTGLFLLDGKNVGESDILSRTKKKRLVMYLNMKKKGNAVWMN